MKMNGGERETRNNENRSCYGRKEGKKAQSSLKTTTERKKENTREKKVFS